MTRSKEPEDLDFLSTEVLLENLAKRFDASLFIAYSERSDEEDAFTFAAEGIHPAVIGLAHMAVEYVKGND